ncbi:MAG: hypothetical protein LBD82_03115 [Deltaproteobacteria bacterium]|nr:hypothetical protein [Deltaproteobacteria bacterium]
MAYPRKENLFEAFTVYRRMYAKLPPVEELLLLLECEMKHNGKWHRQEGRFVPWLKNWLRFEHYEQARQFMELERESAAATAAAMSASGSEKPAELQREEEDDSGFAAYAALWSDRNETRIGMARELWRVLLRGLGMKPGLEEAREASGRYPVMYHWLNAFRLKHCGAMA